MSSFSLVISPPDGSRPGFIEDPSSALPLRYLSAESPPARPLNGKTDDGSCHTTLCYHASQGCILSFGARLEPRYIFAAGQLV